MKVVKTVEVPAKTIKASTKEVIIISCDCCGSKITGSERYYKCSICKRDACVNKCVVFDPDELGDYPDAYCIICADLLIEPRREMKERHLKAEEELMYKVKWRSLDVKTTG